MKALVALADGTVFEGRALGSGGESLGEMVWESQRLGQPFDGERYIDRIRQRATR